MVSLVRLALVAVTLFNAAAAQATVSWRCITVGANVAGTLAGTKVCVCYVPSGVLGLPNIGYGLKLGVGLSLSVADLSTILLAGANYCTVSFADGAFLSLVNPQTCCALSCTAGGPTPFPCNGACQASSSCASGGLRKRSKTVRNALDGVCPKGKQMCPILRGKSSVYECIDTQNDILSCGGCVDPFNEQISTGFDCSAIPDANEVTCIKGRCVVKECVRGFSLASNGTACVPAKRISSSKFKVQNVQAKILRK